MPARRGGGGAPYTNSTRREIATCPKLNHDSRLIFQLDTKAAPVPKDNGRADISSAPFIWEIEHQQHTDGVSFARILSRLKPERQSSQGSHFSRCTTLAQRVQFPLQWKRARKFADVALGLAPRLSGVPRCFSLLHSWAVADL